MPTYPTHATHDPHGIATPIPPMPLIIRAGTRRRTCQREGDVGPASRSPMSNLLFRKSLTWRTARGWGGCRAGRLSSETIFSLRRLRERFGGVSVGSWTATELTHLGGKLAVLGGWGTGCRAVSVRSRCGLRAVALRSPCDLRGGPALSSPSLAVQGRRTSEPVPHVELTL